VVCKSGINETRNKERGKNKENCNTVSIHNYFPFLKFITICTRLAVPTKFDLFYHSLNLKSKFKLSRPLNRLARHNRADMAFFS
jgi:hypothetical protein